MTVTTEILEGYAYLTTGTIGGSTITHDSNKCVEIGYSKKDWDIQNAVGNIPIPVSKNNVGTTEPITRILDLKTLTESITLQGWLNNDPSESCFTKRDNIFSMIKNNRGLRLVFGVGNYQKIFGNTDNDKVFIRKFTNTESSGNYGEAVVTNPPPFTKIDIQIEFLIGKQV